MRHTALQVDTSSPRLHNMTTNRIDKLDLLHVPSSSSRTRLPSQHSGTNCNALSTCPRTSLPLHSHVSILPPHQTNYLNDTNPPPHTLPHNRNKLPSSPLPFRLCSIYPPPPCLVSDSTNSRHYRFPLLRNSLLLLPPRLTRDTLSLSELLSTDLNCCPPRPHLPPPPPTANMPFTPYTSPSPPYFAHFLHLIQKLPRAQQHRSRLRILPAPSRRSIATLCAVSSLTPRRRQFYPLSIMLHCFQINQCHSYVA